MDVVRNVPETLHIGEDFKRCYQVQSDLDITDIQAVCKVRTMQGKLLLQAECHIEGMSVYVWIKGSDTLTINRAIRKGVYDVFIGHGDTWYKLAMGEVTIVPDVSRH